MGKVPTTTEAGEKMSLSESTKRKKYPQAIANWPAEERPREKLLFKVSLMSDLQMPTVEVELNHTRVGAMFQEGGRRMDRPAYPGSVIREAVVNALVHRDYSISGSDITLAIFSDRIDLHNPGRLPNTVTVKDMKAGLRYARNQTLVNIMRDYGYVDFRGMGVRDKIIPGMREHNGTDPDLIEEENRFILRLWKEPKKS